MATVKVADLVAGQKIKLGKTEVFVQSVEGASAIVSKVWGSPYVFGVPVYSPNYPDLMNRVEVVGGAA